MAIQALRRPSVATQVPLDANEDSPGRAGGMLALMLFPCASIAGADVREDAVDRVAVRNTTAWRPERKAIVEASCKLILELHGPGGPAVRGFIDAEVGGIVADGLHVGDAIADTFDVAELQGFGARDYARPPGTAAVGGDDESAAASGGRYDTFVHGTDCDEALRRVAVLRGEFGLTNAVLCKSQGGEQSDQQNGWRAFQHGGISGENFLWRSIGRGQRSVKRVMGGIGRWTALSGGPVRITSVRIAGERKVPRLRSAAPHFARDDKVEDDGVEDDVIEDGVEDDGVEDNERIQRRPLDYWRLVLSISRVVAKSSGEGQAGVVPELPDIAAYLSALESRVLGRTLDTFALPVRFCCGRRSLRWPASRGARCAS